MSRAKKIAEALGGDWYGHYGTFAGPGHSKRDRSVSIKDSKVLPDGVVLHSFAGDDPLEIKRWLRDQGLLPPLLGPPPSPTAPNGATLEYVYRQADGTPYLKVTRRSGKRFFQSHWEGGKWQGGAPKGPKIPYRLPEMQEAVHDTVFLVEGEKDADNLAAHGFVSTTCPGGSNGWTKDLVPHFEGKTVYILPDNDEPGRKFAETVAASLVGIADSVSICPLPGLPEKGDVSDWLEAGGDVGGLVDLCKNFPEWAPDDGVITAAELQQLHLPPARPLVHGFLPEGVTIIAGKPKMGKSWAMLDLAFALASGGLLFGQLPCEQRAVLYAALEDSPRRLQDRLEILKGDEAWPNNLAFMTVLPPLDQGGDKILHRRIRKTGAEVLILDVLQSVRPAKQRGESDYAYDYRTMNLLRAMARELEISIIIVHHLRKADSDDPLDCVSGTTGFTGAADAIITVAKGIEGCCTWAGRGRDLEDFEWEAKLEDGRWKILDEIARLKPDQRKIVEVLIASPSAMRPKEVAKAAKLDDDYVRKSLLRLVTRGIIERPEPGLYRGRLPLCHSPEKTK